MSKSRAMKAARPPVRGAATLRPHPLMLDLLLATVMLFAFQIGPVARPAAVDTRSTLGSGQSDTTAPLLLRSVRGPEGPAYREDGQSKLLSPKEVVALASARATRVALVADPRAPLGEFLASEAPLRRVGLEVSLAVAASAEQERKP